MTGSPVRAAGSSSSLSQANPTFPETASQQTVLPTPEESEVAKHLTATAESFLASILGPGRAKILVTVEGERSRTHTQTEIITPITLPGAVAANAATAPRANLDLPGYTQDLGLPNAPPANGGSQFAQMPHFDFFQKDQEETLRITGFVLKRLRVTCILDSKLSDAQAAVAGKLLPDLLRIDSVRGDELTILRADLAPYWKSTMHAYMAYLDDPQGMNTAWRSLCAAALILLLALAAYQTLSRLARKFADEAQRLRRGRQDEPAPAQPQELQAGLPGEGIPDLIEGTVESTQAADAPALGHRFDFLSGKKPAEIGKLLLEENPQDLALLFGYLTETDSGMAASIFAAMPKTRQMAVSRAMANLTMADPERLAMLETRLRNIVEFGLAGADRLGKILSRMPMSERDMLFNDLMSSSPQTAEEISRAMFSFEDIAGLKPNDLRRLIMAVSYPDWGLALRGAPQELVDRILEQLLPGTQNLIREAMETAQPRAKVLEARSKVLSQTYEMAARGELNLSKEGSSDLV